MMPHPERCAEAVLGGTDGLDLFAGLVESAAPAGLSGVRAGAARARVGA
jgi:hypothetical protein